MRLFTLVAITTLGCAKAPRPEPPLPAWFAKDRIGKPYDFRSMPRDPIGAVRNYTKSRSTARTDLIAIDPVRRRAVLRDWDLTLTTVDLDTATRVDSWRPIMKYRAVDSPWLLPTPKYEAAFELSQDPFGEIDDYLTGYRTRLESTDVEPQVGDEQTFDLAAGTTAFATGDLLWTRREDEGPKLMYPTSAYRPSLSPDGERLAFDGCYPDCPQHALFLASTADPKQISRVPGFIGPTRTFWSPDGKHLYAYAASNPYIDEDRPDAGCLYRVDPVGLTRTTIACRDGAISLAIDPTGKRAAFPIDGELRWIDLQTGARVGGVPLPLSFTFRARLSASGRFVGFSDRGFVLVDLSTGRTADVEIRGCGDARWLSDRELVLRCSGNARIDPDDSPVELRIFDPETVLR